MRISVRIGSMLSREAAASIVVATSLLAGVPERALAAIPRDASPREGTEIYESRLEGADVQRGRMSWFGQYGYGSYRDGLNRHVWHDSGDNGINASGLPQTVPGIALMDRRTLGHWFEVELNGRVFLVRQVDVGPHPRTGRRIDINAPLCDMAGWSPHSVPTDSVVKWRHVGSPQAVLAMRQRPKLKELALLETWDLRMTEQPRLAYDIVSPALQPDAPRLTRRAAVHNAPWLATAPKTVDVLTSARHWATTDKRARAQSVAMMRLAGPMPLSARIEPEPVRPSVARTAQAPQRTAQVQRLVTQPRAYRYEPPLGELLFRPVVELMGFRW